MNSAAAVAIFSGNSDSCFCARHRRSRFQRFSNDRVGRFRSRHAAGRREQVPEPATELGLVDAGLIVAVRRGNFSTLDALGGITPPPRGLLLGLQLEKMCPLLGGHEHHRRVARTHQRNWTVAGLNLVGERTDRVGVVQWFEPHALSMAQIGGS
jgi:hypothetical protein